MSNALFVFETSDSPETLTEQEKQVVVYDEYRRRLTREEVLAALASFTGAMAAIRRLRGRETNRQGEVEA